MRIGYTHISLFGMASLSLVLAGCGDDVDVNVRPDGGVDAPFTDAKVNGGAGGGPGGAGGSVGGPGGGLGGAGGARLDAGRDTATGDASVDGASVPDAADVDSGAGDAACPAVLSVGSATFSESMGSVNVNKADNTQVATLNLDFGFGSALFRDPTDPAGVFWAVTDRGPNIDCDSASLDPGKAYCDKANKVFPKPDFSPTLVKVTLSRAQVGCALQVGVSNKLPILDKDGNGVTGLPIAASHSSEKAVSANQMLIPSNDSGLDTEGLVRLPNGTFWLAEEYGPSLVHIDATGKVVERVTPEGVKPGGAIPFAPNYPVTDGLPGILTKRKQNRGFESLAVSPDGRFLYTALQSPMLNPDVATGEASLVIRIHKVSLTASGAFDKVEGEWLYLFDNEAGFVLGDGLAVRRRDLKISEMVALATDDLLVQERTDFVSKIYRVKLTAATVLDAAKWDSVASTPALEAFAAANAAFAGVSPLTKTAVWDGVAYAASNQMPQLPGKIEGVTVLGDYLVLVNDNDFNAAQKTVVTLLPLPAAAK